MHETNSLLLMRKRLLTVLLSITFFFCALSGRLFYLQVMSGEMLKTRAAEQWYRDLPLKAPRGKILDKNGEVLADSRTVYTVYVRPRAVKDLDRTSRVISAALNLDCDKLKTKLTGKAVSEITIMREVDGEKAELIRKENLDGVYFSADCRRNYPEGNRLEQVIGFTDIDNIGQSGLERYYDKYLRGRDGASLTETDMQGIKTEDGKTEYIPPIAGCNVRLSVDAAVQSFAENAAENAMKEFSALSAGVIVMDAKTGGILAMASAPNYDNNAPPRKDLDMLMRLSKNKMITDVYEPGSTFKIFTTAIALSSGKTRESDRFFCPGYRIVDGKRIKCWRTIGHGSQDLIEGVKNSCNGVFMDLARRVGTESLYEGLNAFGFGEKTGVDFYGESRGIMMNKTKVKNVDLARIGFGQAVAVTPLQLITAASAAVNGGNLFTPYFVESIDSPSGENIYRRKAVPTRKVMSEENSKRLRAMLEKVVSEGGGKNAGVAGYRIGGKTGTAQKYADGKIEQGKYVSSFVGFAPAIDPKYTVLVLVDEPSGYAYYGSIVAAPYAGKIFENIFAYFDEKPTEIPAEKTLSMPDLIDMSLSEASTTLKAKGLQYELCGEGGRVIGQYPMPNAQVKEGEVVLIRTK